MIFQAFNKILNLNAVGFYEDGKKSKNSGIRIKKISPLSTKGKIFH